jgi:hypothetical protein
VRFYSSTNINSANAFVELDGVGSTDPVTQGNFLFLRTVVPMVMRLTMADPAGGPDLVSQVPVHGLLITEFSAAGYLKLLEIKGVGGVEWFISGNQ